MSGKFDLSKVNRVVDQEGCAISSARLLFVEHGSDEPVAIFADSALTIPTTNPVVADMDGYFRDVFLEPGEGFDVQVSNQFGMMLFTISDASVEACPFPVIDGIKGIRCYEGDSKYMWVQIDCNLHLYRDCTGDNPAPSESLPLVVSAGKRMWCWQSLSNVPNLSDSDGDITTEEGPSTFDSLPDEYQDELFIWVTDLSDKRLYAWNGTEYCPVSPIIGQATATTYGTVTTSQISATAHAAVLAHAKSIRVNCYAPGASIPITEYIAGVTDGTTFQLWVNGAVLSDPREGLVVCCDDGSEWVAGDDGTFAQNTETQSQDSVLCIAPSTDSNYANAGSAGIGPTTVTAPSDADYAIIQLSCGSESAAFAIPVTPGDQYNLAVDVNNNQGTSTVTGPDGLSLSIDENASTTGGIDFGTHPTVNQSFTTSPPLSDAANGIVQAPGTEANTFISRTGGAGAGNPITCTATITFYETC